eukprot:20087-Heterococcus_DN1.PRE.4
MIHMFTDKSYAIRTASFEGSTLHMFTGRLQLTIDSINVVPIIPRAVCRRHSFRPVRKEHSVARSCIRVTVAARSGHECDVVAAKGISTKAAGCTTAASAAAIDAL